MEIYITENLAIGGFETKYPENKVAPIETRNYLDHLKFPEQEGVQIFFISIYKNTKIRTGVIYTLSGRGNSNRSAIVEYDVFKQKFGPDGLFDIIEQLKKVLEKGDYSSCDTLKLGENISDGDVPSIQSFSQNGYAYREYSGEDGLKELFANIDQVEYRKYEAVFFIEKDGNVKPWDDVKNISDISLETYCTLTPAEQTKGVKVKIRIGAEEKDFDAPIRVKKGDNVTLKFSREGFDTAHPETDTFKVTEDRKYTMPNIIWSRYISKDNITVRDENLERISPREYTLFVDGTKADPNRGLPVEEKDLNRVKIRIICTGYEVWEERPCNFANNSKEEITLKRQQKEYTIKYNGIEFKGKSKANPNFPKKEVCITDKADGVYEITESTSSLTKIFIVAFISLLAGIALGWFVIANIFKETPPEQAESEVNTEAVASPAPETQETKEFACLKEDIWKKSEMEKVPELQGLYDAISETNRDKIYKYKSIIEKYENGKKLIKALEETDTTTITWGKNPDDNKNGEITITIEDYISRLRGKYKSQQASAKQSQAPSSANNSTTNSSKSSEGSSKSNGMTEEE